jgi:thymidylate synthase (FAD)
MTSTLARLIWISPDCEANIVYIARISNPESQEAGGNESKLINYLIKHAHWSPFEHGYLSVEVTCPLFVATQILRHRSFTFQQYSMRYSKYHTISGYDLPIPELRKKGSTNRQSSLEMVSEQDVENKKYFEGKISELYHNIRDLYNEMSRYQISNETLRAILPQNTTTKLIMTGNVRSFIHYIQIRTNEDTQKEHRIVAEDIKRIFVEQLPIISRALSWL